MSFKIPIPVGMLRELEQIVRINIATQNNMKAHISFKFINPDYSQEYADQYNGGHECESDTKYDETSTWEVENVTSVELIDNGIYQLTGKFADGSPCNISIPNVVIFRIHSENGTYEHFAVSKSVLSKTYQAHNKKYPITRCYFYINSEPKSIKFGENLVLGVNELPDELKN